MNKSNIAKIHNQVSSLIETMRPKQWVKNGFVFVALFFDRKLFDPHYLLETVAGFSLFCVISSVVYIINDLADLKADQAHPTKRFRPLPSGRLNKNIATTAGIIIPLFALPAGFLLQNVFGVILASYFVFQIAYSFILKKIVVLDVLAISAGFVLRVGAGVALVDVERFSPWLYIFTTALSLFLGFSKRRQEIIQMTGVEGNSRDSLTEYSIELLDYLIMIVVTMIIMTYALYTFSAEGLPDNHVMMLTIPFVLYGIFRYLQLILVKGELSPPDEIILKDRPIQLAVILWGMTIGVLLYLNG